MFQQGGIAAIAMLKQPIWRTIVYNMKHHAHIPFALVAVLALGACADGRFADSTWTARQAAAPAAPATEAPIAEIPRIRPPANARTADQFDTTTAAERVAATAPAPAGGRELGRAVISLGNPAEPGFWLTTGLVTAPSPGRIEAASGTSVQLELRPAAGDGSSGRLSLPAFRALGLPLTSLPEVRIFTR